MTNVQVAKAEAAYMGVVRLLNKRGYIVKSVVPLNDNRYFLIHTQDFSGNQFNVLVTYKRELFYSFGDMFRDQGAIGAADTININELKIAISRNVQSIYLSMPDGHIYSISLSDFLNKSIRWTNKEGKEVRSVSIHEYTRENQWSKN